MILAALQMCSGLDPEDNMKKIREILKEKRDAEVLFLPECYYSLSDGTQATPYLVEWDNEHYKKIQEFVKEQNVYLIGGSVAFKENGQIVNRVLNFSPDGELINYYDKNHLFKIDLTASQGNVVDETKVYTPGTKDCICPVKGIDIGISVCFDLRFPEMYREYAKKFVSLISVSSAFTVSTGRAHWEVLLRARAIENQSYVVASAQWGQNNDKIQTYGHTCVIDPWGKIIEEIPSGDGIIVTKIKESLVQEVRGRMNIRP